MSRRLLAVAVLLTASPALADSPAPALYSLPFQLRPAGLANVIRVDTAIAWSDDAMGSATTAATMVLGSYKLAPAIGGFARLGIVHHAPAAAASATTVVNPAFGGIYAGRLPHGLRFAVILGVALPLGMGGGDDGDPTEMAAARAGILARSALDNAMFAVNDIVVFPGLDVAWVRDKLTVQAEVTLLQLARVRGAAVQPDEYKTNLTSGIHVGYFVQSWLSIGTELRYQRWLSTPAAVEQDATGASRDALTWAIGPRFHFELAPGIVVRPALSYARALDDPMADRGYDIVHVDVPASF